MPTVETFEAVPAGTYRAQIGDIEDRDTTYGPRWRWEFWPVLPDGSQQMASDMTSQTFTPRSKAYQWAATALGRKPEAGEVVEFESLRGLWVQVVLEVNESGYNKVAMVLPDQQPQQAPPVMAQPPTEGHAGYTAPTQPADANISHSLHGSGPVAQAPPPAAAPPGQEGFVNPDERPF